MLNNATPAAGEAMPRDQRPGYAAAMLELYQKLDALRREYTPMDDETMNAITEATAAVGREIIGAPAVDEAAIATKLRFGALLVEEPGGIMADECVTLLTAMQDLRIMRDAEWHEMVERNHPWYAWVPL